MDSASQCNGCLFHTSPVNIYSVHGVNKTCAERYQLKEGQGFNNSNTSQGLVENLFLSKAFDGSLKSEDSLVLHLSVIS